MTSDSNVKLVIKPHTRGMKVHFLKNIIKSYDIHVAYETSSFELSQWCDLSIVYASSIGLQVLYDKKLLVCPSEFDNNLSIYEHYGAAYIVRNINEMLDLIENYGQDKRNIYYSEENVESLFKDVVYAGRQNIDIIKNYVKFLQGLVKN